MFITVQQLLVDYHNWLPLMVWRSLATRELRSRLPCGVNNIRCSTVLIIAYPLTMIINIQGQYSDSSHPLPGILHTPQGSLNVSVFKNLTLQFVEGEGFDT